MVNFFENMLFFWQELLGNQVIIVMLIGVLGAQVLKVPWHWARSRQWDLSLLWSASGMPSSHSTAVSSVATYVGLIYGFGSALFAICFLLAIVVMYDARGVRRAAGEQAEALNYLLKLEEQLIEERSSVLLEQRLGHTTWQVAGGMLFGMSVSMVYFFWQVGF